jgi:hypothetical protein
MDVVLYSPFVGGLDSTRLAANQNASVARAFALPKRFSPRSRFGLQWSSPMTQHEGLVSRLAELAAEPVSWLWPGRLAALGVLSLLAGKSRLPGGSVSGATVAERADIRLKIEMWPPGRQISAKTL